MPIDCPGGQKPRYRVVHGDQRLAWCGSKVVERKNLTSGKVHTMPSRGTAGQRRRRGKPRRRSRGGE